MADYTEQENFETEAADNKPVVELFIKASPVSKEDKGACPISQQWFMVFYVLAEKQYLNLFVTTVNPDSPPESYTALEVGRHLPTARVISGVDPSGADLSGTVFDTNDEIEQLMDIWKCPTLALPKDSKDEGAAEMSFADLYKNLNLLLKTDSHTPLLNNLRKLNGFLASRPCDFLLANELTYADCQLMPKLHHVRMAAKFYRDFDIPEDMQHLHQYFGQMYKCDAFCTSCPADRDLYCLYLEKVPKELQHRLSQHPSLMDDSIAMLQQREANGE